MNDLPKGWISATLGDLAEFHNGAAFKPSDWSAVGIPIIRIQNLTDASKPLNRTTRVVEDRLRVSNGDILVSWSATLDAFIWDRGEAWLNQHIFRVVPNEKVVNKAFLFFMLRREIATLVQSEHLHGSTMKHINRGPLLSHVIALPPLREQHRIVERLNRLIARSKQAHEELARIPTLVDRYKQAILSAAFRGTLTEDWRKVHEGTALDFLQSAGTRNLKDQSLWQLPTGWSWVTAGSLCDIKSGITLGKKRSPETKLVERPYLRVANVQRGWLNLKVIKTILVTEAEAAALYLKSGDILMNEGGDRDKLGRGWVWSGEIPECIHQNHVFRLRPKLPEVPSKYLSYYANEFGQTYFQLEGKQTTNLASISMSKISALPIPIAPAAEMARIVKLIADGFSAIERIELETRRSIDLLDRLEQSAFSKAFSGKLVPQSEDEERVFIAPSPTPTPEAKARLPKSRGTFLKKRKPSVRNGKITLTKSRHDEDINGKAYLAGMLKQISKPASVEELFRQSGLTLTDFYKQLSWEVDRGFILDDRERLEAA